MSNKNSKNALNSPDQVTEKLREGFVWTTAHSKMVITAIIAFVVVGAGVSISGYLSTRKETTYQEKYFPFEKAYTEKRRGFEEAARLAAAPQPKDKKTPAPVIDPSKKATGDMQKDYGDVISGFEGLVNEVPSTKAGQMSALNLSNIYLDYKKNDEALATLQKVEKDLSGTEATSALIYMQMGNIYADKGDCKSAVSSWEKIANNKSFKFAHDEAKLRMGLCYESMNDLAKAESLYTEVSKKEEAGSPNDMAAVREADKYLRLLKAKKSL